MFNRPIIHLACQAVAPSSGWGYCLEEGLPTNRNACGYPDLECGIDTDIPCNRMKISFSRDRRYSCKSIDIIAQRNI